MEIKIDDYSVYICNNIDELSNGLERYIEKFNDVTILVDENTQRECLPLLKLKSKFNIISIESGEKNKNIETSKFIWNEMIKYNLTRNSLFINLGGGVIGDMGGFVASTYLRGIDFINIPTTLLSMVDSSVGGKLGIDFNNLKNYIGVFNSPKGVFVAKDFLNTLSNRELLSGFAEMIKHSLITNLNSFYHLTETFKNHKTFLKNLKLKDIYQSIEIKKNIVLKDFYEKKERKLLNFGHTIGHAIESVYLNRNPHLLHGEAIILGMICEMFISNKILDFPKKNIDEFIDFTLNLYTLKKIPEKLFDEIYLNSIKDKKNYNQNINCVLLNNTGNTIIDCKINKSNILESLKFLNTFLND